MLEVGAVDYEFFTLVKVIINAEPALILLTELAYNLLILSGSNKDTVILVRSDEIE